MGGEGGWAGGGGEGDTFSLYIHLFHAESLTQSPRLLPHRGSPLKGHHHTTQECVTEGRGVTGTNEGQTLNISCKVMNGICRIKTEGEGRGGRVSLMEWGSLGRVNERPFTSAAR